MVRIKSKAKAKAKAKAKVAAQDVEDKSKGVVGAAEEAAIWSLLVEDDDQSKWEETEKAAIVSLSEASKTMVPSHFAAFLNKQKGVPELDLWRFNFYLEKAFSQVSPLPWFHMLNKSPLSLVPLSYIPKSIYETQVDWINKLPTEDHWKFVTWALDRLLTDWVALANGEEQLFIKYQVATLVELAMVLRGKPDSFTRLLPMLRGRPMYQGQAKLPLILWMMAQAFQHDLPTALYSWAHNLLPLTGGNNKCYSPELVDLILQFVEKRILSNPEARTILVNGAVKDGERLIPPCSFEILLWHTFPASSTRVEEAAERFEAIYPVLKEVALAPDTTSTKNAAKQIFTFSLKLAGGQGNPALANEATAIAFSVLTQNVDCFKQWDILYMENLEASLALLKKLVDEWEDHSLKLSSSPSDTLTVNRTINSFRMKNEKAITEGVANPSLYIKADKSCKLISTRLSHGSGGGKADNSCKLISTRLSRISTTISAVVPDVEDKSQTEKATLSLSEAAEKINPSSLSTYLNQVLDEDWYHPLKQILKLVDYYGIELSQVSFQWVNMFEEYPLSKLIDVPLSLIPIPVYGKTLDFINTLAFETLPAFVLWASDLILTEWPGVVKVEQLNSDMSKVALFVVLAMVLRTKPNALTLVLPKLRERPTYQGQDKLPVLIWMMAQASQGDLCAGLYSWVRNLLPLVVHNKCYSPHSIDLILQFVEMILSTNPEARAVLVNGAVRDGERLIPPYSFEMLVRLTFPAPSARVEATERFEAMYPLLKEVALAPGRDALKQIFTFSLKLAGGQGNPALANEAIEIAIRSVTENVDCFKQWDVLYKENLEASVALLKKLLDEWEDHSFKLSSSPTDTLTVKHAIYSFRMKNEKAITKGVADPSLYIKADKSCKLMLTRLSRRSGGRKIAPFTTMVIAAAAAVAGAAFVLQEAPHLLYLTS